MQVDTRPDTMTNIASYFQVSSDKLQRHYKHQVSGYKQWHQLSHAYSDAVTYRYSPGSNWLYWSWYRVAYPLASFKKSDSSWVNFEPSAIKEKSR